jgi:transcriptional regulator with GAF, ATPase, and Fis domain
VESLYLPAEETGGAADGRVPVPHDGKALKEAKRKAQERIAAEIERKFLLSALERSDWNVTRAAAETGMQRTYFQALMRKRGVKLPAR